MKTLFLDMHILSLDAACPHDTATTVAVRQAMSCGPIYYGAKVHYLWTHASKSQFQRCSLAVHTVVDATLARIQAEVQNCDFLVDFCIFDVKACASALLENQQGDLESLSQFEKLCRGRCFRLFRQAVKVTSSTDAKQGVQEFMETLYEITDFNSSACNEPHFDNRHAWRQYLRDHRVSERLKLLIDYYLSIKDSSSDLESNLSVLIDVYQKHCGPLQRDGLTLEGLLEIRLDGPKDESELACRSAHKNGVLLKPSAWTQDLATIWLQRHGRRFGLYKLRSDKGTHREKKQSNTESSLTRSQAAAADWLYEHASQNSESQMTILGYPRADFKGQPGASLLQQPQNKELERFYEGTKQKQLRAKARSQRREANLSPYPVGDLRRGNVFGDPLIPCPSKQALAQITKLGRVRVVDLCNVSIESLSPSGVGVIVSKPSNSTSINDWLASIQSADLLVVEDFQHIQDPSEKLRQGLFIKQRPIL